MPGFAPHDAAATPHPRIRSPLRMEPTSGVRRAQPNFSAPTCRHSLRCREEKGLFFSSSVRVSSESRIRTGSFFSLMASSSIADSARKTGNGAGAAHGGGRADVATTRAEVTLRFGAVEERWASPQFSRMSSPIAGVVAVVLLQVRVACHRVSRRVACVAGCADDGRVGEHHLAAR